MFYVFFVTSSWYSNIARDSKLFFVFSSSHNLIGGMECRTISPIIFFCKNFYFSESDAKSMHSNVKLQCIATRSKIL